MADEFQLGSGSWWDSSKNRFDGGTSTASSISTTLNAIASYGWPTEMVDMKNRSSLHSASASAVLQGGDAVLPNPNMQMMGLGLSSQGVDWNQALLGEKADTSFRSLLQEDMSSNSSTFPSESGSASSSQEHWRQKIYSGGASSENEFNQVNHGFSLDHASPNDSTHATQNLTTAFQVDSAAAYGFLLSQQQQQQQQQLSAYQTRPIVNYPYPASSYAAELMPSANKYPQFLRTSPPKQAAAASGNHLHFTNNTPFWNASASPAAMTDSRPSYFPALETQISAPPSFDEKPKNKPDVKKNNMEASNKRPRSETPTPLPAFKARKEKMGDRITALQQLVSPFGKTDTASVLSEAIEYIKFLHEQVSALSAPYMKNGAPMQNQQNTDKVKDAEGHRQDLRSRGLCLVPVSSTFPMTHETAVDFWTPTFGGTFR